MTLYLIVHHTQDTHRQERQQRCISSIVIIHALVLVTVVHSYMRSRICQTEKVLSRFRAHANVFYCVIFQNEQKRKEATTTTMRREEGIVKKEKRRGVCVCGRWAAVIMNNQRDALV